MPGNKSASSGPAPAPWCRLELEETGGFAGLCRGTGLARAALSTKAAQRADKLLRQLVAAPGAATDRAAPGMPDAQWLRLQVQPAAEAGPGEWTLTFNTAELPAAMTELLTLCPPMRPRPIA